MSNWWLKTKPGGWLYLTYHKLNAQYIGMYWGRRGLCPFCGKDHHAVDRENWHKKFEVLKETGNDQ